MKPKTGLDLFGEETGDAEEPTTAELGDENHETGVDAEDDYDNWIVDDLGGGMQDEPAVGDKPSNGYIKEMGMCQRFDVPFFFFPP